MLADNMKNIIALFFLLCMQAFHLVAQTNPIREKQLEAVNAHLSFTNEAIHGMLIVHRMLENFNQEVNKYVDLESAQVNFYGNADLPANVFLDLDHYFYETTPYEWFEKCRELRKDFPDELANIPDSVQAMKTLTDQINALRFTLDGFIQTHDLTQAENLRQIYDQLENGVTYYDRFYALKQHLWQSVSAWAGKHSLLYEQDHTLAIYTQLMELLDAIRNKDREGALRAFNPLRTERAELPGKQGITMKAILDEANGYLTNHSIPEFYNLYRSYYYYYNVGILNRTNRYGNGWIAEVNQEIRQSGRAEVYYLEEPHFFKVIYPERDDINPYQAGKDTVITDIPQELEKREIRSNKVIYVDDPYLTVQLYDHKDQDGDIVSINFNGEWVLKKQLLKNEPIELKLRLNDTGRNYLVLHAENIGKRPPNTMALKYTYRGNEREIILNSDMKESELIEIEYTDR